MKRDLNRENETKRLLLKKLNVFLKIWKINFNNK